jgi:hypothetical protein
MKIYHLATLVPTAKISLDKKWNKMAAAAAL